MGFLSSVNSNVAPPPPVASAGHPHGPWEEWVPAQHWLLQPRLWYLDPIFSHVPWGLPSGPSPTQWSLHGLTCPHSEKTQTHLSRLGSRVITSTWKPALTTTPTPGLAEFLVFYVRRCFHVSCRLARLPPSPLMLPVLEQDSFSLLISTLADS